MAENAKNLERFRKVIDIVIHTCTGCQIIVLLMVLICSLYIAFSIFEVHLLDFTEPFIESTRGFVVTVFGDTVQSKAPDIDGKVVLFILLNVLLAFFISQLKMAFTSYGKDVDKRIIEAKNEEEHQFNETLQAKLKQDIMAQSNFVIAVQFKLKYLLTEGFGVSAPTQEELEKLTYELVSKFYEQVKTLPGLRFSKDENILLISSNNIKEVDPVMLKIWDTVAELKIEYKAQKFGVRVKAAVESYKSTEPMTKAYKAIRPLLDLNANNEMLCFGNFKNRYELNTDTKYIVAVKGKYDLKTTNKEEAVWYLVKKD